MGLFDRGVQMLLTTVGAFAAFSLMTIAVGTDYWLYSRGVCKTKSVSENETSKKNEEVMTHSGLWRTCCLEGIWFPISSPSPPPPLLTPPPHPPPNKSPLHSTIFLLYSFHHRTRLVGLVSEERKSISKSHTQLSSLHHLPSPNLFTGIIMIWWDCL